MPFLPAPAPEPRHSGGAGGAGPAGTVPLWHAQKIALPKRVWGSGHYSPGAVRYRAQLAALDMRRQRCRAGVATLAAMLGDSKRTAERYLAELAAPGPDGVPETDVIRHTDPGGRGTTAERRVRPLGKGEHFAYVDVCACKALRPTQFVLYCALAYADAMHIPATASELAALLGVSERTVRRLLDALDALGWITLGRRAGYQGRHVITVNGCPGHGTSPAPSPDTNGGSGPDTSGGSLAIKEDTQLTDGRSTPERGSFRRRRDDGSYGPAPVDTCGNTPRVPAALRGRVRPAARPAYAGPPLTLSPRVWAVLDPVRDLLPACTPFTVRRIAREVGRQLDTGVFAEDIRDQLTRMRAQTHTIHDPGRWILGAALPARPGPCNTADCYRGYQRHTGTPCKACTELTAARLRTARPPHTSAWHECNQCRAPAHTPFPHGLCTTCQPTGT